MFSYRKFTKLLMLINKKYNTLTPAINNFKGNNYIIVGSPKGIGYTIAKHLAINGAKVTLVGKRINTQQNIFTAAEEINDIVKKPSCMGVLCDINIPQQVDHVINETLDVHGSVNGLVLGYDCSYLKNTHTLYHTEMKHMTTNINGTYLFGQKYLQHMQEVNSFGHLLIIAPPLQKYYDNDDLWTNHLYYTMTKMNMSLMSKYWDKEFSKVSVNTLWPKITVPLPKYQEKGDYRLAEEMAKATCRIFKTNPLKCHGNHYIDYEVNNIYLNYL